MFYSVAAFGCLAQLVMGEVLCRSLRFHATSSAAVAEPTTLGLVQNDEHKLQDEMQAPLVPTPRGTKLRVE